MKYYFFIFILLLSSCSFLRKVRKQESRTDSTVTAKIDSSWLKKIIEESQYTKTTDRITIQLPSYDSLKPINYQATDEYLKQMIAMQQAMNAAGNKLPPINIYPPGATITLQKDFETGKKQIIYVDSGKYKADEKKQLSKVAIGITRETRIGLAWWVYALIGLVVILAGVVLFLFLKSKKQAVVAATSFISTSKKK